MRTCSLVAGLALSVACAAHADSLEFPDLGLSSSPQEVRAWAREHGFASAQSAEPGVETYQRELDNGQRERVGFVPGHPGLDALRFDHAGVPEVASVLRRKLYEQLGTPQKDQIISGGTLRLTYPYEYSEPARRMFLLRPHYVSMMLVTDAYVGRNNEAEARAERAKQEKQQAATRKARNAWLVPLIWIGGIALALLALNKVVPRSAGNPVARLMRRSLDGLFGLTHEVLMFVVYQASGFLMYGMFFLSTLTVVAGAAEWGTSWWWGVPLLFGAVMMFKAHDADEGFLSQSYVATAFFAAALIGPMTQHWVDAGAT